MVRRTPATPAKSVSVGTRKKGGDGHMYVAKKIQTMRWVKVAQPKPRKSSTRKKPRSKPKKATTSRKSKTTRKPKAMGRKPRAPFVKSNNLSVGTLGLGTDGQGHPAIWEVLQRKNGAKYWKRHTTRLRADYDFSKFGEQGIYKP